MITTTAPTLAELCDSLFVIRSILETSTHLLSGGECECELSSKLSLLALDKVTCLTQKIKCEEPFDSKIEFSETSLISDKIQSSRENLGLSEADLARQLNTYSDHISDWECGITEPPASIIIPLANALKCDPLWLLTGSAPEVAK